MSMLNRNFMRLLMMGGGLLPRLFRDSLGNEGVCGSVGFWEETVVLFFG